MKKGKLIVISGPSGVGKSTIRGKLLELKDNYWYSISMTTRTPRKNEKEGIDYFFVTKDEFLKNIANNNFIEYARGSMKIFSMELPKDKIDEMMRKGFNVILEIDVEGAMNIKNIYPDALLIFIAPPDMQELESRLRLRKTDDNRKVTERLNKAYKEMAYMGKYDYVLVNDDVEKTVQELTQLIEK